MNINVKNPSDEQSLNTLVDELTAVGSDFVDLSQDQTNHQKKIEQDLTSIRIKAVKNKINKL